MARKRASADAPLQTRADVKAAVRELMDETAVHYSNGAVEFANRMTEFVSRMVDSFDGFFTTNFVADRPQVARTFLDARLRAARETQRVVTAKIADLEKLRARAIRGVAPARRRAR